jgi:arsenite methyltransferase
MTTPSAINSRPDYGLDAPAVVRNLFLAAAAALAVFAAAQLKLLPALLVLRPSAGTLIRLPLAIIGLTSGCALLATGIGMVWTSKVGKIRRRERVLDAIAWTGNERVLDVGCGRGLMLIGAAKRLTSGRATGVDIWQAVDLTGNNPDSTRLNAARENVADRIDILTQDMRQLPFADGSFDVIVSCNAIHNLSSAADRATAVREIARVLKPGGAVLIDDIRHHGAYAATLAAHGCREIRRLDSAFISTCLALFTFGQLRPAVLLARKSAT